MTELLCFAIGVIAGLIIGNYLPADVVNNYANQIKIKRSTVSETEITQTEPVQKKPGIFKRWKQKRIDKKEQKKSPPL